MTPRSLSVSFLLPRRLAHPRPLDPLTSDDPSSPRRRGCAYLPSSLCPRYPTYPRCPRGYLPSGAVPRGALGSLCSARRSVLDALCDPPWVLRSVCFARRASLGLLRSPGSARRLRSVVEGSFPAFASTTCARPGVVWGPAAPRSRPAPLDAAPPDPPPDPLSSLPTFPVSPDSPCLPSLPFLPSSPPSLPPFLLASLPPLLPCRPSSRRDGEGERGGRGESRRSEETSRRDIEERGDAEERRRRRETSRREETPRGEGGDTEGREESGDIKVRAE